MAIQLSRSDNGPTSSRKKLGSTHLDTRSQLAKAFAKGEGGMEWVENRAIADGGSNHRSRRRRGTIRVASISSSY